MGAERQEIGDREGDPECEDPLAKFLELSPLIYYFNRGSDHESRLAVESEADALGLPLKRAALPQPGDGSGRANVIKTVIEEAIARKIPAVTMLADGVELHPYWGEAFSRVDLPADWGILVLGGEFSERPGVVSGGVVSAAELSGIYAITVGSKHFGAVLDSLIVCGTECAPENGHLLTPLVELARSSSSCAYALFPPLVSPRVEVPAAGGADDRAPDGVQGAKISAEVSPDEVRPHLRGLLAEVWGGTAWREERGRVGTRTKQWRPEGDKVAFLFLTRGNRNHPQLWDEYFDGHGQEHSVYAHCKDPVSVSEDTLKRCLINAQVETEWGNISLVHATLALLREALEDSRNGYFVLASESCVPIKPFGELIKLLRFDPRGMIGQRGAELMEKLNPRAHLRIKHAAGIPRNYWRFHSQWFLINRDMAEACVASDLTHCFAESFAPDEGYFSTVLQARGYPLAERASPEEVTFTQWTSEGAHHPDTFGVIAPEFAAKLARSAYFFARKFAPESNVRDFGLHLAGGGSGRV